MTVLDLFEKLDGLLQDDPINAERELVAGNQNDGYNNVATLDMMGDCSAYCIVTHPRS